MKFTLAVLSIAATATAFTAVNTPARSVARVGASNGVFAPVPVRAAGT
jgi:hypothetical protein